MKSSQTAAQAKYWLQYKYPKKTKITAVVQGEDEESARLCALLLKDLGYKKIKYFLWCYLVWRYSFR